MTHMRDGRRASLVIPVVQDRRRQISGVIGRAAAGANDGTRARLGLQPGDADAQPTSVCREPRRGGSNAGPVSGENPAASLSRVACAYRAFTSVPKHFLAFPVDSVTTEAH
jgi:hypothetical protein